MKHILYFICFLISISSIAQPHKDKVVESIDGVINELLMEISIEKGEKMDTAAIRKLFHPSAQFMVSDSNYPETASLDEFLELLMNPYYEQGYLEKEIHKKIDEYNGIAHVFQSFYGKDSEGREERGINSYQLTYYKQRWWIINLLWTIEPDNFKIPNKYIGN